MFSPSADYDPAEREKGILSDLIKRFIVYKEEKREPSYGILGTQLKDDYYQLDTLKKKYPEFILTNKTALLGDVSDPEKQSFLNSVDSKWREKGGRRTNRLKKTKTKTKTNKNKQKQTKINMYSI
jgi:hypothetical protein